LELDLNEVVPSLAGPKRPQDRVALKEAKASFKKALTAPVKERGFELPAGTLTNKRTVEWGSTSGIDPWKRGPGRHHQLHEHLEPVGHDRGGPLGEESGGKGTSGGPPHQDQLGAGVPRGHGLPGRRRTDPLLEKLNFHLVGYGCTTCIGNSGPLPEPVSKAIQDGNLVAAAVLSGNRNFEGRINPHVKANYLASPPLVVAYALAGRMDLDLTTEPLGQGAGGPVYLKTFGQHKMK
jgi:aconitate hydratase